MSRPKEKESRHLNLTPDVEIIALLDAMAAVEKTSRTRVFERLVSESSAVLSASSLRNYENVSQAQDVLNRIMAAADGAKIADFRDAIEEAEAALDTVSNTLSRLAFPPRPNVNSRAAETPKQTSIPADDAELKAQELSRKPVAPAPTVDKPARVGQTPKQATAARKEKAPRA